MQNGIRSDSESGRARIPARILNVDDNEAGRYVLTKILRSAGYAVLEAADGRSALQMAATLPDLIILDVNLPDINGFEVCRKIKDNPHTSHIPVVHISAVKVLPQERVMGLEGGADGYLVHPISPQELLATVKAFLRIKESEKKVRLEAEYWQTTFNSIHDGITLLARDGSILRYNEAFATIVSKEADEIIGQHCYKVVHGLEGFSACCPLQRILQAPSPESLESNNCCIGERWFHVRVDPVLNEMGEMVSAIHIMTEITEKRGLEISLRESEERFRRLAENAQDIIFRLQQYPQRRLDYINPAVSRIAGYSPDEFYLDPELFWKVVYPDDRVLLRAAYQDGIAPERSLVIRWQRKDGMLIWVELRAAQVRDEGGRLLALEGIIQDVTERKRYESELLFVSMHDSLTGLYNRAYFEEELRRLQQSRAYPITIISLDMDSLKLTNDTLGHAKGDELLQALATIVKALVRSSDVVARIGGDEFVVILPQTDSRTGKHFIRRLREGVDAYNTSSFGTSKIHLSISAGMATAKQQEHSLADLYKEADDLMYRDKLLRSASTRTRIIDTLMAALAERDHITEGHAKRLASLCRKVGEQAGLTDRQLTELAILAQVHDLGKVGIPDHVLFKKGPLTEEEWQIMRQHSEKGFRIAMSSPDLAGVADLILKHHERWDGSGYPLNLKGQEIPIECRILAIVDAYDAMVSNRPYRRAMSRAEAIAELLRNSGIQFDPRLVEIFLDILDFRESDTDYLPTQEVSQFS